MRTRFVIGGAVLTFGLLAAALWQAPTAEAAPVTGRDATKAYPFPAGRYILAGGKEAARGQDLKELQDDFYLRPGQYILSGGSEPTDLITVDDDLELKAGDKTLFVDDDHIASTERRGKQPATYQGFPIVLVVEGNAKLRVKVIDWNATDAIVGELWLHRHDGSKRKLTAGVSQQSAANLPHTFFDEEYDLTQGFEKPAKLRTANGSPVELPAHPANLLKRDIKAP